MERDVPAEIVERRRAWQFYYKLWYTVHYALGVLAILASLTVAYMAFAFQSQGLIALLSLLAAVCTALNYFLMPYRNARGYVNAWRLLTAAEIEFKTKENRDISILHQAIDRGEAEIAKHMQ
ncbi:MAG: hypothetical protein ACYSWU_13025 [Planctomycetota bacterium]